MVLCGGGTFLASSVAILALNAWLRFASRKKGPMWNTFPLFGSTLILAIMVMASYTFAVSLAAGATGRVQTLRAARFGAYGTVAVVATAVLLLAYAFVTHDFRIRYVAHYSDRTMTTAYLLTALWGGQDGSILWWLFLLAVYIAACVKWLGKKYLDLQPYIIATLMAVVIFFAVVMAFAADPFSTNAGGAPADGEGLNPLLQNYWMIIHPPALYTGFVGTTIPFAFAVAALITGRLDHEWIVASRKWMIFAWLFLAIGNCLGMVWSYEELGWGGYWAWDPVENAAFFPLVAASAYIHSVMLQERRGMLRVWNVTLISLTFFLTIFGTFLTRSGAIASVHAFAQSGIGDKFVAFMALIATFMFSLILYRWPELRGMRPTNKLRIAAFATGWLVVLAVGPGLAAVWKLPAGVSIRVALMALVAGFAVYIALEIVYRRLVGDSDTSHDRPEFESVLSREFTFLMNNWGLMALLLFVVAATTFPMLSEAFWGEKITVPPPFYFAWVPLIAVPIFFLMGVGTLFGWRKTTPGGLLRAFRAPTIALFAAACLHAIFGARLGFPPVVWSEALYPGALGSVLRVWNAFLPLITVALIGFNTAVIVQEFVVLVLARKRSGSDTTPAVLWWAFGLPGLTHLLFSLSPQARRRYGGYVVHLGIVIMFLGFTGKAWNVDKEASMVPGDSMQIEGYTLKYVKPHMEMDETKRMAFATVDIFAHDKLIGRLEPAKFIYKHPQETVTTEVAIVHTFWNDIYAIVGQINPQTGVAGFQFHVNPLVSFIWAGFLVLIAGSVVCLWPEFVVGESRIWAITRSGAGIATSAMVGVALAGLPASTHTVHDIGGPGWDSGSLNTVSEAPNVGR